MALTQDKIKGISTLSNLTQEQIDSIVNLSAKDENEVIGTKVGEIHGAYEKDILNLSGIKKNDGEKAYDYNKRVLTQYKTSLEDSGKTLETLKTEKAELEDKLKNSSSDEVLKKQLQDTNKKLADAQDAIKAKTKLIEDKEQEFNQKMTDYKVNAAFDKDSAGLKFKPSYSQDIVNTLMNQARNQVLETYKPDFVTDASGNQTMVFRDKKTDEIVRNPNNSLNPYTVSELLGTTVLKDVIDTGKKQPGGGTGNPKPTEDGSNTIDLSGATTQKKADDIIYNYLMEKGIARGSNEFAAEQAKLRNENDVAKLPIR